jgi:hypothetical protein
MSALIPLPRVLRWMLIAASLVVCRVPAGAADNAAAKVVSLAGRVSILRDNAPWVINVGDAVQPRQIIVTGADSFAVFELADGSTFEVYPNSRIIFRDNPGNWRDLLEILIGRVKLQIQRVGGAPNFNRVRTPTAVISVRGTVFNVDVEDEDATTLIVVEEGQVAVEHSLHPTGKPRLLNSGEWIRVFKNQPLAKSAVDKGSVMQNVFRAAAQALYEAVYRTSRPASGSGSQGPSPAPAPKVPADPDPGAPPGPPPPAPPR